MAVSAITDDYIGERKDKLENFGGAQILYIAWDAHLMFCSPVALPVPPTTPFSAVVDEMIPGAFAMHPEFDSINWDEASWLLNGEPFTPDRQKSLQDLGIDHKSILRFATPGLDGIKGSGS